MELYLFRPKEQERLYSCINITIEDVKLDKRQNITEGIITIALATIYYMLYIPCIPSMYRHMKNPCYKLLFYISIVDCAILWAIGFVHGYFAITGAVFCSHPTLMYLLGCYLWLCWSCESSGQLCLVINRCVGMLSPDLETKLFAGNRIYLWIGTSIAFGVYWFLFNPPLLFTGIHFSWLLNPYVGYREDPTFIYVSYLHIIWNAVFAVGVPMLYIIFAIAFFAKSQKVQVTKEVAKQQKMMLLQVFIISMLNFCCCSIYVYMMYFVTTEALMHFAEFCWLHIHGFPPVIYLAFNSTIQKDAKRMIKKVFCKISEREFKSTVTTVKPQINRTQGIKKGYINVKSPE